MRFGGGVCSCCQASRVHFRDYHDSQGCGTRRRPLTRPFSVHQRGAGGVERPHNPRSDAIRTCFRSAERLTTLFVCRGMLCLGYASSGEEGIVSEDISRSRMRLVQTRRRASCLGLQCGRFWCPCVGVMLPRGCGLCVEGQAVEVAQRSVRTNLRGMCA